MPTYDEMMKEFIKPDMNCYKRKRTNPIAASNFRNKLEELRDTPEMDEYRRIVRLRDNNTCQKCRYNGFDIDVHHILEFVVYKDIRSNPINGICLCRNCHKSFHDNYGYHGFKIKDFNEYMGYDQYCYSDLKQYEI